jgi:hypothetical protein
LDFDCATCKKTASALADRSSYVEDGSDTNFIRQERRIDSYKLNWRLIVATQLMGESRVGGSIIIGMFLDVTREAFQTCWGSMEDLLGVHQREIGKQFCDLNLLKETVGKIGELSEDGTVCYPIGVLYDMEWQKAKRTYDSL